MHSRFHIHLLKQGLPLVPQTAFVPHISNAILWRMANRAALLLAVYIYLLKDQLFVADGRGPGMPGRVIESRDPFPLRDGLARARQKKCRNLLEALRIESSLGKQEESISNLSIRSPEPCILYTR